jgi:hypothetical protein
MRSAWIVGLAVAIVGARGDAEPKKKPGKGFWKILVKSGAKWTMRNQLQKDDTLTVETYDVRELAGAQVARLRWTVKRGNGSDDAEALKYTHAIGLTQLAVTDAGLYLLWAGMDDAKVTEALKGKPARSDPPKPYKGTKLNEGRYLEIDDDRVCMGQNPIDCNDCDGGAMCVSASAGIVSVTGTWAPVQGEVVKDGLK